LRLERLERLDREPRADHLARELGGTVERILGGTVGRDERRTLGQLIGSDRPIATNAPPIGGAFRFVV
jgi:hypothetical protein